MWTCINDSGSRDAYAHAKDMQSNPVTGSCAAPEEGDSIDEEHAQPQRDVSVVHKRYNGPHLRIADKPLSGAAHSHSAHQNLDRVQAFIAPASRSAAPPKNRSRASAA